MRVRLSADYERLEFLRVLRSHELTPITDPGGLVTPALPRAFGPELPDNFGPDADATRGVVAPVTTGQSDTNGEGSPAPEALGDG
jgi:rod shape-determining protein MreC